MLENVWGQKKVEKAKRPIFFLGWVVWRRRKDPRWLRVFANGTHLLNLHLFAKYIQGVFKKRYFLDLILVSVPEVGFHFFTCVLESEF